MAEWGEPSVGEIRGELVAGSRRLLRCVADEGWVVEGAWVQIVEGRVSAAGAPDQCASAPG